MGSLIVFQRWIFVCIPQNIARLFWAWCCSLPKKVFPSHARWRPFRIVSSFAFPWFHVNTPSPSYGIAHSCELRFLAQTHSAALAWFRPTRATHLIVRWVVCFLGGSETRGSLWKTATVHWLAQFEVRNALPGICLSDDMGTRPTHPHLPSGAPRSN